MAKITVEGKEWLGPADPTPESLGTSHFLVSTIYGTLQGDDYPSGTYISDEVPASAGYRHRPKKLIW